MTYVDKRLMVYGITGKIETTYGVENAPSPTTDGYYPQFSSTDMPELIVEALDFNGDLGPNSAGLGPNMRVPPSGRSGTLDVPMYFRGAGLAYASGVIPLNNFHVAMQAMGYAATGSFSVGTEKWTYQMAADSVTPTSQTLNAWGAQVTGASTMELVKLFGGLGSLKMAFSDPKPPIFTFGFKGIYGADPAESAFTPPTIVSTPLPALSTNLSFSYGSFSTAIIYSGDFDLARTLDPRAPLNNTGAHLGFVARGHVPVLNLFIERSKFATWNPYSIRTAAGTAALNLTFGSTQYNKIALDATQAQLIDPIKPVNKGGIACWQLTFLLPPSTPGGTDSHTWTAK